MKSNTTARLYLLLSMLLLCSATFVGCNNIKTQNKKYLLSQKPTKYYLKANFELAEYVSKVSKRILMVSDTPSLDYKFIVTNDDDDKSLEINKSGVITINRKILESLKDEAQLAAVISYIIAQSKPDYNSNLYPAYDKQSMEYLARAGYNPIAAIELQQLHIEPHINSNNWLNHIFLNNLVDQARIAANMQTLENLPKGLPRSEQNYQKNLGILQE